MTNSLTKRHWYATSNLFMEFYNSAEKEKNKSNCGLYLILVPNINVAHVRNILIGVVIPHFGMPVVAGRVFFGETLIQYLVKIISPAPFGMQGLMYLFVRY